MLPITRFIRCITLLLTVLKNFQQNLSAFIITNQTAGSFNLDFGISLINNSLIDHKKRELLTEIPFFNILKDHIVPITISKFSQFQNAGICKKLKREQCILSGELPEQDHKMNN